MQELKKISPDSKGSDISSRGLTAIYHAMRVNKIINFQRPPIAQVKKITILEATPGPFHSQLVGYDERPEEPNLGTIIVICDDE